jgi:hypothetical protein
VSRSGRDENRTHRHWEVCISFSACEEFTSRSDIEGLANVESPSTARLPLAQVSELKANHTQRIRYHTVINNPLSDTLYATFSSCLTAEKLLPAARASGGTADGRRRLYSQAQVEGIVGIADEEES